MVIEKPICCLFGSLTHIQEISSAQTWDQTDLVSLKVAGVDFCAKCLKSVSLSGGAAGQHRGLFVRAGGPDRQ